MSQPNPFRQRYFAALVVAFGSADLLPPTPLPMWRESKFSKVDDHVYRGAQPTREGFISLRKLGIRR